MPPKGPWKDRVLDHSDIDRTPEYEEFLQELQEYHDKRGTVLQREPELGRKKLDLLKLYKRITSLGGYDHCTTEKGAWRDIAQTYKLAANNTNAGYLLKTIYYKNLAAYELSNFFGEEPPPKEILEHRSAAGGPIRGRTLENYRDDSPSAEPTEEKSASPQASQPAPPATSISGRSLRQAPPQRQFYQPPVSTPRASKMVSSNTNVTLITQSQPQQPPAIHSQPMVTTASATAASVWSPPILVPSYPVCSSLGPRPLPITAPAHTPHSYVKPVKENMLASVVVKCGAGHTGPAPMIRIVMGLRSGLPDEVKYALQNLVRVSFEWGDSFKSDEFPGMAEALIDELSYLSRQKAALAQADGCRRDLVLLDTADTMETKEGRMRLDRILDAALVLRNMSIHVENAKSMARSRRLIDTLVQGITLPPQAHFVELKHYCLDIAEALSSHLALIENEALYTALKDELKSDDRSIIISSIRAITRLVGRDETNRLSDIDSEHIRRIQDLLLLEDDDLVSTCLDFLYSYTAVEDNVSRLMSWAGAPQFLNQLKRLLLHHAEEDLHPYQLRAKPKNTAFRDIPDLPPEIVTELLSFPEPERATQWMRCSFEEDSDSDITQIALWQAYQTRFTEFVAKGRPLLPAADFIKNVSVAFTQASAMVVQGPPGPHGPSQKFIIKGIRPRVTPLSTKGVEYLQCRWNTDQPGQTISCRSQLPTPNDLFAHILDVHLKPPPMGTPVTPLTCSWSTCYRFPPPGTTDRRQLIAHIRTHMPDRAFVKNQSENTGMVLEEITDNTVVIRKACTAVDDRGEPAGVGLTAALVLRNIARSGANRASSAPPSSSKERMKNGIEPVIGLPSKKKNTWDLAGMEEDLHHIATLNSPLSEYIYELLTARQEIEDLKKPPAAIGLLPVTPSATPGIGVGVGYGFGGARMAAGMPQTSYAMGPHMPMGTPMPNNRPRTFPGGTVVGLPPQATQQAPYAIPSQMPGVPPHMPQMVMPHPQQPVMQIPIHAQVPIPPPTGGTRMQM